MFKIGFLEVRIIDVLDVILVALLLFQLYRLIRGSLAFNIFIGLLLVYLAWFTVRQLEMELLTSILTQFVEVGVIVLLIVFQPEVRRFLLFLGRGNLLKRVLQLRNYFGKPTAKRKSVHEETILEVMTALENMKKGRIGAILVFSETSRLQFFAESGVEIDARVNSKLLESIFETNSPLHDGAVIISGGRIVSAGSVLPVSDNPELPSRIGMRHKATVGITEQSDAVAFVVSEERGIVSYARNGRLIQDINEEEIRTLLEKFFESSD